MVFGHQTQLVDQYSAQLALHLWSDCYLQYHARAPSSATLCPPLSAPTCFIPRGTSDMTSDSRRNAMLCIFKLMPYPVKVIYLIDVQCFFPDLSLCPSSSCPARIQSTENPCQTDEIQLGFYIICRQNQTVINIAGTLQFDHNSEWNSWFHREGGPFCMRYFKQVRLDSRSCATDHLLQLTLCLLRPPAFPHKVLF